MEPIEQALWYKKELEKVETQLSTYKVLIGKVREALITINEYMLDLNNDLTKQDKAYKAYDAALRAIEEVGE